MNKKTLIILACISAIFVILYFALKKKNSQAEGEESGEKSSDSSGYSEDEESVYSDKSGEDEETPVKTVDRRENNLSSKVIKYRDNLDHKFVKKRDERTSEEEYPIQNKIVEYRVLPTKVVKKRGDNNVSKVLKFCRK